MGARYYSVGIKEADQKFKDMKKIYDACKVARVDVPREVIDFFDEREPDPNGVRVDLPLEFLTTGNGYQIQMSDIPKDVKIIKFLIDY